ncbi:MAG: hypothetical protein KA152_15145 [Verrucomicrobiales bacterium]|nr:hypothetical protein [Verrucomicrobiales bacterium]
MRIIQASLRPLSATSGSAGALVAESFEGVGQVGLGFLRVLGDEVGTSSGEWHDPVLAPCGIVGIVGIVGVFQRFEGQDESI